MLRRINDDDDDEQHHKNIHWLDIKWIGNGHILKMQFKTLLNTLEYSLNHNLVEKNKHQPFSIAVGSMTAAHLFHFFCSISPCQMFALCVNRNACGKTNKKWLHFKIYCHWFCAQYFNLKSPPVNHFDFCVKFWIWIDVHFFCLFLQVCEFFFLFWILKNANFFFMKDLYT